MSTVATVLASTRPRFLVLTPVCVLLGYAAAMASGHGVDTGLLALALIAALCAHIAVNTLNEYQDFSSGLDQRTVKTPFSGGSGALPADPQSAKQVLLASVASLTITAVSGLYFVYLRGPIILALGVIGLFIILSYTRWLNRHAWLCLIAPGAGFGLLMVMGTAIALTGTLSVQALWLSLPAFFLVNNLLLLNQFPDIEADRSVGRNHLAIRYGTKTGIAVFGVFLVAAYSSILIPVVLGQLPVGALMALVTLIVAVPTLVGVYRHADTTERLLTSLGLNVGLTLSTLLLLALGVLFTVGGWLP